MALVVSAAAVVGVKAYNYYSMPELMRANLDALTEEETVVNKTCEDTIVTEPGTNTFFCGECDWVEDAAEAWNSKTKKCTPKKVK